MSNYQILSQYHLSEPEFSIDKIDKKASITEAFHILN